MKPLSLAILLSLLVWSPAAIGLAGARQNSHEAFPASPPAKQGLDPEALELLAEEVDRLLAADSLVGAELHVIQNRHTVFQRAFGDADREASRPLKTDALFCVRSMTKPLVGAAIQMLLDQGKLALDTKAAEILPAFETPATASITIEHLLTHTSGLPFTTLRRSLEDYATLADVARDAAAAELLFEPGTGFQYSDAGADTLGAIVAAVTGEPVEEFLQRELLDPLGMNDTWTLLKPESPVLERIPTAYSGGTGEWSPHWNPRKDPPIFPLFLTSQSLYSTTSDYARFLALWMDGGRTLLSEDAVGRALTPQESLPAPSGFEGLEPFYGQQWMIYTKERDANKPVVFGHNGSDGTHAWAWPERDLMVLFFTQTRGTLAGMELERVLDQLLIQGDTEGYRAQTQARTEAATGLAPYEGLYWDEDNETAYYVVRAREGRLTIERPGSFASSLVPTDTTGRFSLEGDASRILEFEPPVHGVSPAFLFPFSNRTERQVRHQPNPDLPSMDSIAAGLRKAHGIKNPEDVGVIRMTGKIEIPARRLEGRVNLLFDGRRSRLETKVAGGTEVLWITADERAFSQAYGADVTELEDDARNQAVLNHPVRRFLDWQDDYTSVKVLRRVEQGDVARILVRTVTDGGAGATRYVDPKTGRLTGEDRFETLPGVGRIGLEVAFGDYRDVSGLMLPFQIQYEYSFAMLGEVNFTFEEVETGVSADGELEPPVGQ